MEITLNGKNTKLASHIDNLQALVKYYDLSPQKVAIELNLEIVAREDYQTTLIAVGDKIEIVEFVGGG